MEIGFVFAVEDIDIVLEDAELVDWGFGVGFQQEGFGLVVALSEVE